MPRFLKDQYVDRRWCVDLLPSCALHSPMSTVVRLRSGRHESRYLPIDLLLVTMWLKSMYCQCCFEWSSWSKPGPSRLWLPSFALNTTLVPIDPNNNQFCVRDCSKPLDTQSLLYCSLSCLSKNYYGMVTRYHKGNPHLSDITVFSSN